MYLKYNFVLFLCFLFFFSFFDSTDEISEPKISMKDFLKSKKEPNKYILNLLR